MADATLARAGLNRLSMYELGCPLPIEKMLPAVAQGVIGLESKKGNTQVLDFIQPLNHDLTRIQMLVERSFLAVLDGSCRTPIGGHALIRGSEILFHGEILKSDGSLVHKNVWSGSISEPEAIGIEAGTAP